MAKKNAKKGCKKDLPSCYAALPLIEKGSLALLYHHVWLHCSDSYPMSRNDWGYVTSQGHIYLNPRKDGTAQEWEYALSLCLIHLGLGHFETEYKEDPLWVTACDLAAVHFLKDSQICALPPEFSIPFPFSVKNEEQVFHTLRESSTDFSPELFSTMSNGRKDMVWDGPPRYDYPTIFAEALQNALRSAINESSPNIPSTPYHRAQKWFLSHYPLLGALASSFRIVDDIYILRQMDVPVAAVSPELKEIYVNPFCSLTTEEWRFVLAHEFLHAALRHDIRRENRDPILWNVACDYVVNLWLCEMHMGATPETTLLDAQFHGMSVEAVYDDVCQNIRFYTKQDPKDLLYGSDTWWDSLDGSETDALYRSALQRGLEYHQTHGRGLLPAGLVEEIYAVSRPPIPWDVQLAKWFDELFQPLEPHRSYARMSRRQSATPDIPRPAWIHHEEPAAQRIFGVVLDTSGSMDRQLLAAALGSIASYSRARDVNHVRVVFCDAMPYDQGIMSPDDIAGSVKVRGRGGTKLQPGIDLLDQDPGFPKDAPLLVITDGACDRLNFSGRTHAFLIPCVNSLPFRPKGEVFQLK